MNQDQRPDASGATKAEGQSQPQGPAPKAADAKPAKRSPAKILILFIILAVIAAAGGGYYWWSRDRISTDDAFVDGHIHPITPRIGGYVDEVLVDDNQEVKQGETLLILDPTDYEVDLASAKAELAEAESTLDSLELGVPLELTQTEQRVRSAKAELASLRSNLAAAEDEVLVATQELERTTAVKQLAALDLKRMNTLLDKKAVAQATQDKVRTDFQTSQALELAARNRLAMASKKRDALRSELGKAQAGIDLAATGQDLARIKSSQVKAQQARVNLAKAKLRQAELNLEYTRIKAPVKGRVSKRNVEPGRVVSKGQSLMAIVPLSNDKLWVTANFKETELTRIKPGQTVSIQVDTYPDMELRGKVDSLNAGTGAAFSLFPPENATGNYVKVVQRIPVKIVLDTKNGGELPVLRVGMSVVPTVFTNR